MVIGFFNRRRRQSCRRRPSPSHGLESRNEKLLEEILSRDSWGFGIRAYQYIMLGWLPNLLNGDGTDVCGHDCWIRSCIW